jgi:hypothetical protein
MTMSSRESTLFTAEYSSARASFSALAVWYTPRDTPRDWSLMRWTLSLLDRASALSLAILDSKKSFSWRARVVLPAEGYPETTRSCAGISVPVPVPRLGGCVQDSRAWWRGAVSLGGN